MLKQQGRILISLLTNFSLTLSMDYAMPLVPPDKSTYFSLEDAQTAVELHARYEGYTVVRSGSKKDEFGNSLRKVCVVSKHNYDYSQCCSNVTGGAKGGGVLGRGRSEERLFTESGNVPQSECEGREAGGIRSNLIIYVLLTEHSAQLNTIMRNTAPTLPVCFVEPAFFVFVARG
ncbi:hypothetical protein PsorP6_015593 [Peronosclerospora sorghi]|uniref:Uncharacterized protein n=1 Tax=Peronosclerospora sorghi TaxID=230839 RepID=A0ACC0WNA2_9STRA|nr:hypothetical protein PsorP6_015593 [Peronosclerospora sorghi]